VSARLLFVVLVGCQPLAPPPASEAASPQPRVDACRNDIPDCVAACGLRESQRLEYLDYYDRRCAAAILGKSPDEVARRSRDPSECRAARTLEALCSAKDAKETLPTTTRK